MPFPPIPKRRGEGRGEETKEGRRRGQIWTVAEGHRWKEGVFVDRCVLDNCSVLCPVPGSGATETELWCHGVSSPVGDTDKTHSPAGPWVSYFTVWCLSFLICKMGLIRRPTR